MSFDGENSLAVFTRVRTRTAFEEAFGRLETAIKLGMLAPGSRLPAERELCGRLGISRSTLRQALTTLTERGYLHATRGRGGGTFVVDRPPAALTPALDQISAFSSVCDSRFAVELAAAALAAERAGDGDLDALERRARAMHDYDDFETYCKADRRFHIALAELTGDIELAVASARAQGAVCDLLCAIGVPPAEHEISNAQHAAILGALRDRDPDAATRAMRIHLETTRALLDRHFGRAHAAR